jgi:SAM-dependent methyltransferase
MCFQTNLAALRTYEVEKKMLNKKSGRLFLLAFLIIPALALGGQTVLEERGERWTNERQPPGKVMEAIGVKPGMVIGEVGAGRGRYTVQLAARVGQTGKIYANDIDKPSLNYLRDLLKRLGLDNVETILGRVDNPLFPKASLDMAFMILTYHHLAEPVALLRNLIPSLKPGATVVIVDPDPVKDRDRGGRESTSEEKMRHEAGEAGLELVRIETFLEKDNIFILRVKASKRSDIRKCLGLRLTQGLTLQIVRKNSLYPSSSPAIHLRKAAGFS